MKGGEGVEVKREREGEGVKWKRCHDNSQKMDLLRTL